MAAPMRDGPPEGHRARAADGTRAEQANNFEYDDNEWDIGIGDLIIDLDADIEKTDEGTAGTMASAAGGPAKAAAKLADHSATLDKGLKMKIKRTKPGTKTSEGKHEIVKSNELNGNAESVSENTTPAASPAPAAAQGPPTTPAGAPPRRASAAHRRDKKHTPTVNTPEVNGVTPPAATPAPVTTANNTPATPVEAPQQPTAAPEVNRTRPAPPVTSSGSPPPPKKAKTEPKEYADACVGTSVGTNTEPDCLGPCEPGTSVTLEGIVWHETEGGVLVVNVTWRGKTYVGTLLDCTRHDWAPPRFCDSPTEELDARTPKGRAKRGRGAVTGGDLSNFTETRSSVHSKLRNGGPKGRRGATAAAGTSTSASLTREAPSPPSSARASPSPAPSPAPPAPSGKRKPRGPEEDSPAGKRRPPISPPASPVLLECPEPNCSKKYKHINGLKYHQSHAHGALDEDESKDNASLSENEESNVEAPSPTDPVKSPEKVQEPETPKKEERQEVLTPAATPIPSPADASRIPRPPSPTLVPVSSSPSPTTAIVSQTAQNQNMPLTPPTVTNGADSKPPTVKPGVLRFGPQEDFPVANFISKPPVVSSAVVAPIPAPPTTVRQTDNVPRQFSVLSQGLPQTTPTQGPPPQHGPHQPLPVLPIPNHIQHPVQQNAQTESALPQNIGPPNQQKGPSPSPQNSQFKVKPTAALMPTDDKKLQDGPTSKLPQTQQIHVPSSQIPTQVIPQVQTQPQNFKKNKSRKSPGGSPSPDRPQYGIEPPSRDEVQSPAYSDISDDNAPESEVDKAKVLGDKKPDGTQLGHGIPPGYGMYQFFGQNPYLVPSLPNPNLTDPNKLKDEPNKPPDNKSFTEKEIKREIPPDLPPQKMLSHYYPYGYVPPGYPYNLDPNYGPISMVPEDKLKEQEQRERERNKESPNPVEHNRPPPASPQQQNILSAVKPKQDMLKDGKHPNENHQIIKESIEMKNQMNPYLYQRHHQQQQAQHVAQQQAQHVAQQQAQQQAQHQAQHQAHQQAQQHAQHQAHQHAQQREEELRRFYMSMEHQRRKESVMGADLGKQNIPPQIQGQNKPLQNQGNLNKPPPKDTKQDESPKSLVKEEPNKSIKQEGQKPTMETTGPPPPPTSQFYLHSPYMPPPHYGGIPFDPMYRGLNPMIVPGPYGPAGPYLHPSAMPRYHPPEDLSRPPPPPKALDVLQHHASQYYSSHKIHELQERALKSPTPKAPTSGGSPGGSAPGSSTSAPPPSTSKPPPPPPSSTGEPTPGKDSRSPPPQRHVHTHHHTHVGLGYPLYPAPYGAAAVLASQQAAAVTVVNNFPPK